MSHSIETYRGFVYPWSIDNVGHMNVQFYVGRFDEASWHFLARLDLAPRRMKEAQRSLVALGQSITYKHEVLAGSLLHVKTELLSISEKTMRYRHTMFDSETDQEVAAMELLVAYFDMHARKTTPFPPTARALADAMLQHAAPPANDSPAGAGS